MASMNKKRIIVKNIEETIEFAKNLAKNSKSSDIICLEGDLGVGKSVIAKAIGKFFNVKTCVVSPTFNILKTYNVSNNDIKKINHFDLYRIKDIQELQNIGFEENIYEDNTLSIIEWPEIAYEVLPTNIKKVKIKRIDDNSREITF